MIIVLTGFMGTGKSTVGRLLSLRLGVRHLDTDVLVEEKAGKSIKDIFSSDGESAFRALEREAVLGALSAANDAVISTGGGALVNADIRSIVKERAILVTLSSSVDVILKRVSQNADRPLLSGGTEEAKKKIEALLKERALAYSDAHLVVDTTNKGVEAVTEEIAAFARQRAGGRR